MAECEYNLRPRIDFEKSREEFCMECTPREYQALMVATAIHQDDIRLTTGEPYLNHCLAVTNILRAWGADEDTRIAGLLHDTIEDHPEKITLEEIREMFGERVARLVDGVTRETTDALYLEKVAREAMEELNIVLLKCADRLHNLSTMDGFSDEKKALKAWETLEFYVPMAESLGLWQVKNALADIAFSFADPTRYKEVKESIDGDRRLNSEFIRITTNEINELLANAGMKMTVEHQVGGYWELSEKQIKSGKKFEEITDVVSFRVLSHDENNLGECYKAMGIVRTKYGRLLCQVRSDDYLAVPAMNGYSALHDTYSFEEGNVEIAFTTRKRERFNNWGIASLSDEEIKRNPDKFKDSLSHAIQE